MVLYTITLKLISTFRTIGLAIVDKITQNSSAKTQAFAKHEELIPLCDYAATFLFF